VPVRPKIIQPRLRRVSICFSRQTSKLYRKRRKRKRTRFKESKLTILIHRAGIHILPQGRSQHYKSLPLNRRIISSKSSHYYYFVTVTFPPNLIKTQILRVLQCFKKFQVVGKDENLNERHFKRQNSLFRFTEQPVVQIQVLLR
jgi:hypothetical protein